MDNNEMININMKAPAWLRAALKLEAAKRCVEGEEITYQGLIRIACEELLERSDKKRARKG